MKPMADPMDALLSEEDVDEVLKLALRKQGHADPDLRSRLAAAAEELGITPDELALAEQEYAQTKEEKKEFVEFKRRQVREFREHFFAYIIINTLLVAINWITAGTVNWAIWPILGWGVGLAFHAWGSLNSGSESFQEEFANFRRKRRNKKKEDERWFAQTSLLGFGVYGAKDEVRNKKRDDDDDDD
jgi:hypothetical protein